MLINVFGNSSPSHGNGNKIDSSIFVQKPYLKNNYREAIIGEDLDLENQYRIKNLSCLVESEDFVSKSYGDSGLNDSSIIRNTAHVDFKDKKFDNVRFVIINSLPTVREHVTTKFYVDEAISQRVNESS